VHYNKGCYMWLLVGVLGGDDGDN